MTAPATTDNDSSLLTSDVQNRLGWCITHGHNTKFFLV